MRTRPSSQRGHGSGQGEIAQLHPARRSDDVGDSSGGNEKLNAEVTTDDRTQNYGPLKGECCTQSGEQISGTYFFPGAGMDGVYVRQPVSSI